MLLLLCLISVSLLGETLESDIGGPENFLLGAAKVTRDEAKQLCQEQSMKLVSIQNSEKNEDISRLLQNNNLSDGEGAWTSGNKIADGTTWTWLDGSKITYLNWGPGEPNSYGGNESCIEVFKRNTDAFWNDLSCDYKRAYICEKIENQCNDTILESISVDGESCSISSSKDSGSPNKKFYISTYKASYSEAKEICSAMFMELAELESEEENNMLYGILSGRETTPYWIGGKREVNQIWKWSNGKPIKWFNWSKEDPDHKHFVYGAQWCLEVSVGGNALVWNHRNCCEKRLFICEKKSPVVKIIVRGKLIISDGSGNTQGGNNCNVIVNIEE
ncbi:macrophage mannose receptor 1 [Leptinotarsa decemlineata]|uniref:macrophage mannose receptor 1 n=1 Tax=Leptinotarsa decemlineata TaxID=7539 RepID=UPI003D304938